MSHRGSQDRSERAWRSAQYRRGKDDARAGRPACCADQHYQRGYREATSPSVVMDAMAERLRRAEYAYTLGAKGQAVWTAPNGQGVEYEQRGSYVWCKMYDGSGNILAINADANLAWLEARLGTSATWAEYERGRNSAT